MASAGANAAKGVAKVAPRLSLGRRIWNAMSEWTIRNSGYQQYGKKERTDFPPLCSSCFQYLKGVRVRNKLQILSWG